VGKEKEGQNVLFFCKFGEKKNGLGGERLVLTFPEKSRKKKGPTCAQQEIINFSRCSGKKSKKAPKGAKVHGPKNRLGKPNDTKSQGPGAVQKGKKFRKRNRRDRKQTEGPQRYQETPGKGCRENPKKGNRKEGAMRGGFAYGWGWIPKHGAGKKFLQKGF